ncbi:MAG TPA: hypothetical protein VFE16_00900 [Candidatus Cybelea sp.]|nr:hypothetical protein [Candidatus Cybelea sp.]
MGERARSIAELPASSNGGERAASPCSKSWRITRGLPPMFDERSALANSPVIVPLRCTPMTTRAGTTRVREAPPKSVHRDTRD